MGCRQRGGRRQELEMGCGGALRHLNLEIGGVGVRASQGLLRRLLGGA